MIIANKTNPLNDIKRKFGLLFKSNPFYNMSLTKIKHALENDTISSNKTKVYFSKFSRK
jgi:hypothetical protein